MLAVTYGDGHPMASLGEGAFAVLVERGPDLGTDIATLRAELGSHADRLGVQSLVRQPPRVWLEALPETHAGALELLAHIGR